MENYLNTWLNEEIERRGWTYSELARRARISTGTLSNIMAGRNRPGLDFCVGISRALDKPPEKVLRLAGLLPALPPAVAEEGEAMSLFRRLNRQARGVVVTTMRSLLGLPSTPGVDEPQTLDDLLAYHIENQGQYLTVEEERAVFDLMKTLRDRGEGAPNGVVEAD